MIARDHSWNLSYEWSDHNDLYQGEPFISKCSNEIARVCLKDYSLIICKLNDRKFVTLLHLIALKMRQISGMFFSYIRLD